MVIAERQYRVCADVVSERLDEQVVLLKVSSGTYFELNASGALIWDVLQGEPDYDVAALTRRIAREFSVSETVCKADIDSLLEDLQQHGLVEKT